MVKGIPLWSPSQLTPTVCLSEIPAKSEKGNEIKVVIKPRPSKSSDSADNEGGMKRSPSRSLEDREEEYDRARARIFSNPGSPVSGDNSLVPTAVNKDLGLIRSENEINRNLVNDTKKNIVRDGSTSRVAIIRDTKKDRFDPDYDRSYGRYVRSMPADRCFGLTPYHLENSRLPYMQHGNGACFPQYGLIPRSQSSVNYGLPPSALVTSFSAMESDMASSDALYLQWPNHTMINAHSYEQFRHAISQAPFNQHSPSLKYSQNLFNRG